jgi:hypothetical protein
LTKWMTASMETTTSRVMSRFDWLATTES